jgi:hypothetical protein
MGNYYLPRAKIPPPESLIQALWPWVDKWLAWFNSDDAINCQDLGQSDDDGGYQDRDDMAAQGFLRLLNQFRTIILQDSVLLQKEFPEHPMWDHTIFQREDYQDFARLVSQSLLHTETPREIQLQQTIPMIADRLSIIQKDLHQTIDQQGCQAQSQLQKISSQLDNLLSGRVAFTVRASEMPTEQVSGSRMPQPTSSSELNQVDDQDQPTGQLQPHLISNTMNAEEHSFPPAYTLSRTIQTVPELWQEWTQGIEGNPPVEMLERRYGSTWRSSHKEAVLFSRRKVIINEIYSRKDSGFSIEAAVEDLELVRTRAKLSLYKLWKLLSKPS